MPEIRAVNDFVIKFANVNGTGSASANNLFAKAVFRMGVPVSPRNIFPSNIQGLPTWYEVRVSEAGHLGRRGGVDIMVAMNPATLREDVDSLLPGGYLLHDSSKPIDRRRFRSDINWIGIPLTEICLASYEEPRQRQLFKNIVYVGALSALLDMDFETVTGLVADQFRGKDRLIAPNVKALELGSAWVRENLECPIGIRVRRSEAAGDRILVNGNSAAALGCVYAGATVAAWYPITPSTSLVDAFATHCERLRVDPDTGAKNFAVVQAEDELAAIGMAIGACWNGARGFTATSGPGISLMTEFLGLAYFAEIPVVLFDIQRGSPSTGMPTRTQQADLLACAYASHGDTKHVLLFPKDPTEAFDFAATAFDLAERLQTPVIVMSDLDLGMNDWTTGPFRWDDSRRYDRGKTLDADGLERAADWGRYLDVDGDGIPWRTIPRPTPSAARTWCAAPRTTSTPATPKTARSTVAAWSGSRASSRPRRASCRSPSSFRPPTTPCSGYSISGPPPPRWRRPSKSFTARASSSTRFGSAGSPSAGRSSSSSPGTRRSSWSSRTGTARCARCW